MATQANKNATQIIAQTGVEIYTDFETLNRYADDLSTRGSDLLALVRPKDIEQLAAAVAATTRQNIRVIPLGGGTKYAGSPGPPHKGAVIFDLVAMDRIIEIDEIDMTVTVEAGCTWAKLYKALHKRQLRVPFTASLSNMTARIGNSLSNDTIFRGSPRNGNIGQSCLSMGIVIADGSLLNTGPKFTRPYGPDITGLFLADTGALGLKATATLRMIRAADAVGCASFSLKTFEETLAAIAAIGQTGLAMECFAIDPNLNMLRQRHENMISDIQALGKLVKKRDTLWSAIKEGAKTATAERDIINDIYYTLHILTEGCNQLAADQDIIHARTIALSHGGIEIDNFIPKISHANPFESFDLIFGARSRHLASLHGLLPHSTASKCYSAIAFHLATRRDEMDEVGISSGILTSAVSGSSAIIEPYIYRLDGQTPTKHEIISRCRPTSFAPRPANDAGDRQDPAAKLAQQIKQSLVDLFCEHGTGHLQAGCTHCYRESLSPAVDGLLLDLKTSLDPKGLMNPGSLGL